MFTKPCARAPRGCLALAKAHCVSRLAQRQFCSPKCVYLARVEGGLGPGLLLTHEQLSAAGKSGGREAGVSRRRAAMLKAIGSVEQEARQALTNTGSTLKPEDFKAIEYLLANIYLAGWKRGHQAGWSKAEAFLEQARKRSDNGVAA